ncbi:hypothetical protein [Actinoplanes sp. NPDC049681]|uniref:hypothetical protein n=1 Tax=Actinoplanes sp. NPDC049681 TaxID=3363905 RepID=UPI00379224CF
MVLTVAGCASEPPPPELAALPGTVERGRTAPLSGAALTRVERVRDHLQSRLEEHYEPPWDTDQFSLPAGTPWDEMTAHYAAELGRGWEVDTRFPEGGARDPGYRCRVWSDGDRAVAIALSVGEDGGGRILTVLAPKGDG